MHHLDDRLSRDAQPRLLPSQIEREPGVVDGRQHALYAASLSEVRQSHLSAAGHQGERVLVGQPD